MKKMLLLTLVPLLAFSQVKPKNPINPTGTWDDNMVRAVLFDEGSGTTLDDKSPTDATVSLNTATGMWQTDGEGTYVTVNNPSTAYIELNAGLPGASIQAFTVYIRLKYDSDVTNAAFMGAFTCSPTPEYDFNFGEPAATTREFQWRVFNSSGTEATCNPANNLINVGEKHNYIMTYDGANARLYYDNVEVASAALTGDMRNSGRTTRVGQSARFDVGVCNTPTNSVYTICIWQRVITASERAQIQADPYVMFRPTQWQRPPVRRADVFGSIINWILHLLDIQL